jgi:DNA-binding response OmpR family regulator
MKSLRILIVEDEAIIGVLLAEVLAGMGHDVCGIATTETEAVAIEAQSCPDLLIVDAGLRDGSGVGAVAEILRARSVPHIFITGDLAGVRALKPDAMVLEKPFLESDLIRAIERLFKVPAGSEKALVPLPARGVGLRRVVPFDRRHHYRQTQRSRTSSVRG